MKAMRAAAAPAAPAKSAMKKVVVVRLRPPMRAMAAERTKVPAAPKPSALRKGAWYDALTGADKHQSAMAAIVSGTFMEFEVMDESGGRRGEIIAEVIGQKISSDKGLPVILITPIAAVEDPVRTWMASDLVAPNGLYVCKGPARVTGVGVEGYYIHKVERFRIRSLSGITEPWAAAVHARAAGRAPPAGRRAPGPPPGDGVFPPAPGGPADGPMRAVADLEREIMGGAAAAADGHHAAGPELAPPGPLREPAAGQPPGSPQAVAPGTPRAPPPAWAEPLARSFVSHAFSAKQRKELPFLSVRERLAARAARPHVIRTARRLVKGSQADKSLEVPDSDEDEFKAARRDARRDRARSSDGDSKKKRRKRCRKHRKGDRDSSSGSRSSSRSSDTEGSAEQLFREASSRSSATKRSQRDAVTRPHAVLVESLADISKVLPSGQDGASLDRAAIYKKLPALFVPYFTLVLGPVLEAAQGGARSEREARTICETLDQILKGHPLPAVMILLARLKAIEEASDPDSGGWQVAQHHELIPRRGQGLVNARDRENAARDQRDVLRTRGQVARAGPLARSA